MTSPLILVSDDLCKFQDIQDNLGIFSINFSRNRGFGQQFASLLRHFLIDKSKGNAVEREVEEHTVNSRDGVETNMDLMHKVGWITNYRRALHKDR